MSVGGVIKLIQNDPKKGQRHTFTGTQSNKCPRKNWCLVNVDVKGVFQHHTWVKECVRSVLVLEKKCDNNFFCDRGAVQQQSGVKECVWFSFLLTRNVTPPNVPAHSDLRVK